MPGFRHHTWCGYSARLPGWQGHGGGAHVPAPVRRRRHEALPDRTAIELDGQAVRRIDRAFIPVVGPDVTGPIDPRPGRVAGLVDQVEIRAVLCDLGE